MVAACQGFARYDTTIGARAATQDSPGYLGGYRNDYPAPLLGCMAAYKEARLKMSVEVKFGHPLRQSGYVPRLDEQLPEYVSVVGAWMRAGEDARVRGAQVARPLAEKAQSEAAQVAAIRE